MGKSRKYFYMFQRKTTMLLNGNELAGYIKQRHFQEVRSMQHLPRKPHIAVINVNKEVVSSKYINVKKNYGTDIGVDVNIHETAPDELKEKITELNNDDKVHGIIVQLPLPRSLDTDEIVNSIKPEKDVDGLRKDSIYNPPTPTAALWLLSGYDIDLQGKTIGVIGQGRLVGAPLTKMLQQSGLEPLVCDERSGDVNSIISSADVIIAATGQPQLIRSENIRPGTIVIDAGTADSTGSITGDVDPRAYERSDIKISPVPGGVGPLTVCALFENLISAYRKAS